MPDSSRLLWPHSAIGFYWQLVFSRKGGIITEGRSKNSGGSAGIRTKELRGAVSGWRIEPITTPDLNPLEFDDMAGFP